MTVQRINPGKRMSEAAIHNGTIYVRGYTAEENMGKSVTDQTKEILGLIDGTLAKAGSDKSKLLSATIYLTDISTFDQMNAVWEAWVAPGNTPARATVEANLSGPGYNVEIVVVAAQ